jgi:DNA-binding Lrp family transcriptional regulator
VYQLVLLILEHLRLVSRVLYSCFWSFYSYTMLTTEQKTFAVSSYMETKSFASTAEQFLEKYGVNLSSATFYRCYQKFTASGNVNQRKPGSGRPMITDEKRTEINNLVTANPSISLRRLSQATGVSRPSCQRILRKSLKLKPYKIFTSHKISGEDPAKRLAFCQWYLNNVPEDTPIFYTDEAYVELESSPNRQNVRFWANENPRKISQRPLFGAKVGIWTAISSTKIYVKFFNFTINSTRYIDIVDEFAATFLTEEERGSVWFQQDNAPPHTSAVSMAYLNDRFPQRLIGKGRWPSRSPDLNICDWFLNGLIHGKVYTENARTVDQLKAKILEIVNNVTPQILQDVFRKQRERMQVCIQQEGHLFEHLLK